MRLSRINPSGLRINSVINTNFTILDVNRLKSYAKFGPP